MFISVIKSKRSLFSLYFGIFFGAGIALGLVFLAPGYILLIQKLFLAEGQVGGAILPTYSFSRNLSVGASGEDVRQLQRLLNQNEATQIAQSGPGSPLNETNYFGVLTEKAVIRFQEIYSSEILSPIGLVRGTGFVGLKTREKLNFLIGNAPTSPVPDSSSPSITSISPTTGVDGTQITITGSGFSSSTNIILTGYEILRNVPSFDGKTITYTLKSGIADKYKPYHLPLSTAVQVYVGQKQSNIKMFTLVLPQGVSYIPDTEREKYRKINTDFLKENSYTFP
jgi:peptidoglycan hydrolase-like protein with peptidoglycan-binding domain